MSEFENKKVEVLAQPLTAKEMRACADEDGYIEGVVAVDLSDIINGDLESFLDIISERLCGSCLLMDVTYNVVGYEEGNVIDIKVRGNIEEVLNIDEDDESGADWLTEGTVVYLEGDSEKLGIDSDYNCRVASTATVLVQPSSGDDRVLVSIDEIDGDRLVTKSVLCKACRKYDGES